MKISPTAKWTDPILRLSGMRTLCRSDYIEVTAFEGDRLIQLGYAIAYVPPPPQAIASPPKPAPQPAIAPPDPEPTPDPEPEPEPTPEPASDDPEPRRRRSPRKKVTTNDHD